MDARAAQLLGQDCVDVHETFVFHVATQAAVSDIGFHQVPSAFRRRRAIHRPLGDQCIWKHLRVHGELDTTIATYIKNAFHGVVVEPPFRVLL